MFYGVVNNMSDAFVIVIVGFVITVIMAINCNCFTHSASIMVNFC